MRGGWGRLALLCAFFACLNPRPEELPSDRDLEGAPGSAADAPPSTFAVPNAGAAAATPEQDTAPTDLSEPGEPSPESTRIALPPNDAGADAGSEAPGAADAGSETDPD
jgi:hypothetical protein